MKYSDTELEEMRLLARQFENRSELAWQEVLDNTDDELAGFVCDLLNGTEKSELFRLVRAELRSGEYKPSEVIERHLSWLFGSFIFPRRRDCVLYVADRCAHWAYAGTQPGRRSFRTADAAALSDRVLVLLAFFVRGDRLDHEFINILRAELGEEERAYAVHTPSALPSYAIAYEIDRGNAEFIDAVRGIILGEAEGELSGELILGILQGGNAELHGLVGKLLLAARLQEGLRQAICENADMGTVEGFLEILRVIRQHKLIRFSSVKRAMGTWTGLIADLNNFRSSDLERISEKTAELVWNALTDASLREEYLESEDSMKIYLALWAYGVYEVGDAVARIRRFSEEGSHHQLLTAGYAVHQFCNETLEHRVAAFVVARHREQDILAAYMGSFMPNAWLKLYRLGRQMKRGQGRLCCTPGDFFESREEAERYFDMLQEILCGIRGKAVQFKPCIFPWHKAELSRRDVVVCLGWIASALGDNERIDRVLDYLDDADFWRDGLIAALLPYPQTEKQKRVLVERVCDKMDDARKEAFALMPTFAPTAEHYRLMEDMLRYKNADMRGKLISLLMQQGDEALYAAVSRLLADKKEEKRTAALDIILQLGKDDARQELYGRCRRLTEESSFSSTKEQILAEQIAPASEVAEAAPEPLYDEGDDYSPTVDSALLAEAEAMFRQYFYRRGLVEKLRGVKPDYELLIDKLVAFVQAHADDEYTDSWGETKCLSANNVRMCYEEGGAISMPLAELWDEFYEREAVSPVLALRALVALVAEGDYDDYSTKCKPFVKRWLGEEFTRARSLPQMENLISICRYWVEKDGNPQQLQLVAAWVAHGLSQEKGLRVDFGYKKWGRGPLLQGSSVVTYCNQFRVLLSPLCGEVGEKGRLFPIRYRLEQAGGYKDAFSRKERFDTWLSRYYPMGAKEFVCAAHAGVISERYLFRTLLEPLCRGEDDEKNALWYLSQVARGGREADALRPVPGQLEFARRIYGKLMAVILHEELRRGESPTRFSRHVFRMVRICGAGYYVRILAALGREPLSRDRNAGRDDSFPKGKCLSHLLSVCVPGEGETAETLAALVKETDISRERLVEAAIYSPAWLGITEEYLGWPGFRSACLYFMAHTSEKFDGKLAATIARHTPLSADELHNGAFDLNWFRSAHAALGDKRFNLVYKAAMYSSDGARHTRARKYADAAAGRLDPAATQAEVAAKRNKDLLMAYAIIPLSNEEDLLERYLYLQQFLRESKKFGAQRIAAEKLAVEMALRNLASNAGYADVERLRLRMETRLLESTRPLMEEKQLGEVALRLVIGGDGRADIACTKGGKALKAIPAKLKKDEYVLLLTETRKNLLAQHARTRALLEQAMEEGSEYSHAELATLLQNPVAAPMLRNVVFAGASAFGYPTERGLAAWDGTEIPLDSESLLRVAHPHDLYTAGLWSEYQRDLFGRGIVQPFRQVFRELYVKTPEEADKSDSRRYAGHQVQPRKALACLRNRRWVADEEEGLQKICYKSNIVARIYAHADWFTPSDIEAPTLEWVDFSERLTGKPLAIRDIPDILFSEIMRDVDLAVSVAHAGGVDPETSHSTIEMRAALLRFTLPLFKLSNVEIKGNHAHIAGTRADYTLHLGSGVVHQKGGTMLSILPVHSQQRGKLFLPFADDDPKTAEIISKALLLAQDSKLQDPTILRQLNR